MAADIAWSKDFFSNTFDLTWNDKPIGEIKVKSSTRSAHAEFNGKRYLFDSEGFFKRKTTIYSELDRKAIGLIEYRTWSHSAFFTLNGIRYKWKFNSMSYSRWSIIKNSGELVIHSARTKKGIHRIVDADEELLLICGLVIASKFRTYSF